jgi:hypothetical protein
LRVIATLLALVAVICIGLAIADMVRGADVGPRGWLLRAGAVVCFGTAVLLNVIAR